MKKQAEGFNIIGDDGAFAAVAIDSVEGQIHQIGLTKHELFTIIALHGMIASGSGGIQVEKVRAAIKYSNTVIAELNEGTTNGEPD